ncbi:hypothetical protein NHX12_007324 [Muraenolepis orangiensis]|uniref:UDP-glucose ceramide glucosyltransferase-like 1 n=1 Tax=Muraenolepis orangiensis TaxID=630683 RepID=A0A9Q0ICW6_9TELE|nr:hypothetical protein NHX12_007324 [Muraenolepis orangiensis]
MTRNVLVLGFFSLFLLNLEFPCPANAASKDVSVALRASWSMTPFLLETSEFIAEDDNEKFWQFVDTVKELTVYKNGESVRSYYNLILKKAGQFLTHLQVNLLRFALSLRTYSPAVAASQQIASDEAMLEACPAFVSVHGQHGCSTKDIKKLLKAAVSRPAPYLYQTDHRYPGVNLTDVPVVILYAEIGTRKFSAFHAALSERADAGSLVYVLRHFVRDPQPHKVLLSGYAVELAIKNAKAGPNPEEVVVDEVQGFLFGTLKRSHPELQAPLAELRKHLLESSDVMAPLKVWELQDLSFQAASRILSVPKFDALKLMRDISQDFPSKARSLTRVTIKPEMRKEIEETQKHLSETLGIRPGDAALYINGQNIDLDTVLDMLRGEARLLEGLHNLGIAGEQQGRLLRLPVGGAEDNYALDIRHPAIMWMNDIESDPMYRSWPSGIQELLRATFPGVIRQIRRNFFNLVLFLDPAQQESVQLVKLAELFYKHKIPLRIGFIFVVNTEDEADGFKDTGVAFYRLLSYIAEEYDLAQALTSVASMYNKVGVGESLSVDTVTSYLKKTSPKANAARILGPDSEHDDKRRAGAQFYKESGLGGLPVALFNGVPLEPEEMDPGELETVILQRIMDATNVFQRAAYTGQLTEAADVEDYLMEQPNVVPRINPLILGTERTYLDFTASPVADDWEDTTMFSYLDSRDKTAVVAKRMKYFTRNDEDGMSGVTTWIKNKAALDFTQKLLKDDSRELLQRGAKIKDLLLQGMDADSFEKKFNTMEVDFVRSQRLFCRHVLKLRAGQRAVVTNGRVLTLEDLEEFPVEDFGLLEKMTLSASVEKVKANVKQMGMKARQASDLIMKVDALLSAAPKGESRKDIDFPKDVHSVLHLSPRDSEVVYDVVAIADPLSRDAQKLSSLLILRVFMNCRAKLSEMPLKSFYRLVLEADVNFLANNTLSPGPTARFTDLPESPLLTLNMITPHGWMVGAVSSPHDLDNIHLQEVDTAVRAIYELEHLLLEGHCFDLSTGQPPRGLQFTLGTGRHPLSQDTIVMANLVGMKPIAMVTRAAYTVGGRACAFDECMGVLPSGRLAGLAGEPPSLPPTPPDLCTLSAVCKAMRPCTPPPPCHHPTTIHDGTDSPADAGDTVVVTLRSFQSKIIKVRVHKKADKIDEDLLSESTESRGLWDSISSITGGASRSSAAETKSEDVLNIFSVASGHLYERFLRIMMLSVLRHTQTPVKFWFLKNYLSPSFKETIPRMAEVYGFRYELVQYEWPRWLHPQTEKQRLIWGYKILFLDVLFPLAVDKIIFVDADQIVRADLKELRDLPLDGAPYGYTPFCDSRREMDGYRFWKSGYWASHLGHRKYHISALYVVDLKKFRKIAAGDRLRGQYQALSQDPNSLSNLDQDLPNNMIHQVSIKSLPQEWLWCETWCDDSSKGSAKTIDLCNNPRTKEPKLMAAARIVPEWVGYDEDIKRRPEG